MTKLLDEAEQPEQSLLTDEQLAKVRLALEETRNGLFATGEQMFRIWRKFGL